MKRFLSKSRLGFTLMEVNLAIFIMAVGILAMVSLYPLAFRESQQSSDDVASAALADGILSPLTAALSSTNVAWSAWQNLIPASGSNPSDNGLPSARGWLSYCRGSGGSYVPYSKNQMKTTASGVVGAICDGLRLPGSENPASEITAIITDFEYQHGLVPVIVASYGSIKDSFDNPVIDKSRIVLCVRAIRRPFTLFSQSVYYTEVHFQGDPNQ